MVRRRSASPKSSSPVRSGNRLSFPRNTPATTLPQKTTSSPQGNSLMSQMAATAGGVAIGSVVGHAVGNMFGSNSDKHELSTSAHEQNNERKLQNYELSQPCELEWQQFTSCIRDQNSTSDSNNYEVCQSFNDIFKQCRDRYVRKQN